MISHYVFTCSHLQHNTLDIYIYIYIYSIFYKPHPISKQQANYLQSNMQWQQMTLAYCSLVTFHTIFFANYGQKHLNVDENENKILNENG